MSSLFLDDDIDERLEIKCEKASFVQHLRGEDSILESD
jgi:hypothetical protein